MFKIKLKKSASKLVPIDRPTLELETGCREPNCYMLKGGGWKMYGVCPKCENPVEIVGLYVKEPQQRPYARHYTKNIPGLANFDSVEYQMCPYRDPSATAMKNYRRKETPEAAEYRRVLVEHFDKVVYLLESKTGVRLSVKQWESVLSEFIKGRGYCSPYMEKHNIPYIFAWLPLARSIYKQSVKTGSELYKAIDAKCKNIELTALSSGKYSRIDSKNKQFVALEFAFLAYKDDRYGFSGKESIEFDVFIPEQEDKSGRLHTSIFKETIEMLYAHD